MKSKIKKILKRVIVVITTTLSLIIGILIFTNWKISYDAEKYLFDDVEDIPEQQVALVLGTSKYLGNKKYLNHYFTYRINAAVELYKAGKVRAFVVSGDNSRSSYNEPEDMRQELVKAGVPDSIIHPDYAGFRTLDSVVRMNKIFGQNSFIIISQQFHNERGVYLAQHHGLTAYGYNAKDVPLNRLSIRTKIRELFARVKVFVDIIIDKQPRYLGNPVEI